VFEVGANGALGLRSKRVEGGLEVIGHGGVAKPIRSLDPLLVRGASLVDAPEPLKGRRQSSPPVPFVIGSSQIAFEGLNAGLSLPRVQKFDGKAKVKTGIVGASGNHAPKRLDTGIGRGHGA